MRMSSFGRQSSLRTGEKMLGEIISIGDELLIGQVVNTNASYIAQKLSSVGIEVKWIEVVGDDEKEIRNAFQRAVERAEVVLVTGGLGPTHDDITKGVVAEFFNAPLVLDPGALESLKQFLLRLNIPLTPLREQQAYVPQGCTVIPNRHGTAPGMLFERKGLIFIVMPGVPTEMKGMMDEFVIPFLSSRNPGNVVLQRTLKTTGIFEATLAEKIGDVKNFLPPDGSVTLAFLPSATGVRLRITAKNKSAEGGLSAQEEIARVEAILRSRVGEFIYGEEEEELEIIVGRLLKERRLTIAIAESCTGGLIAHRITNVSGSSAYFERCVVTYSNESKMDILHIPRHLIETYGAVSREVAEAMAHGIRTISGTSIGLSTTGIAGPTGGTPTKPVGLVWIGYADERGTEAREYHFGDDRLTVKERAAQAALDLVRRKLLGLS